ncbi:MAG: HAMP domain-containing sensor histidine kinase [Caldimonas sp.]
MGRQAIADHFRGRTAALMEAWHAAVEADPRLSTGDSLPRAQLEDHLPRWLELFAGVLAASPQEMPAAVAEEARDAEAHGLQRWQQGYDLHEVTREWGCLHHVLVAELERYAAAHPHAEDLAEARLKLAEQISSATTESAEQYFRLERVEAAGTVLDLERALGDLQALENARAELWQQAAHDLRGNLGVVSNVTEGLGFDGLPSDRRKSFLVLLRNNVTALRLLLDDVTGLARLQAGSERRVIAEFDGADMLRRLCDDVRPLADDKGLQLRASGLDTLVVDGDSIKVRRIVQNLLFNALKYTRSGGVTVTWGEAPAADDGRWMVSVVDTGPGLHGGPGAPLASAIVQATAQSESGDVDAQVADDPRPVRQVQGEGLGLAIVKRLCELLNATIELESVPAQGTTFRLYFPRRYPTAAS